MSDLTPLETQIAYQRSALARSLNALSDTLAPQRVADEAKSTLEAYGGQIGALIQGEHEQLIARRAEGAEAPSILTLDPLDELGQGEHI